MYVSGYILIGVQNGGANYGLEARVLTVFLFNVQLKRTKRHVFSTCMNVLLVA